MKRLSPDITLWITISLGLLSMSVALLNVRGVYQAAEIVARGEGESLLNQLMQLQRTLRGQSLSPEQLDAFRADRPGVSYVAIERPDGDVLSASGVQRFKAPIGLGQPLQRFGSRYRIANARALAPGPKERDRGPGRLPQGAGRRGPPPEQGQAGPPPRSRPPLGDRSRPRPGPEPRMLIEFESSTLADLHARARITLAVSLLILGCFLAGAFLLRHLLKERQRLQEQSFEEQRLRSLGEMSAVLAHEIRNPLASLKGNAQLLVESAADHSKEQRKAQTVVNEAARLEKLCSGLLEFVRDQRLDQRDTSVSDLVDMAITESTTDTVKVDLGNAPESWWMDQDRIRQVLSNLVRNAVQADPVGPVQVVVASRGSQLTIAVEDRGDGIPNEHLGSLFEPFFTTKTEGTGLGLAVAEQIVQQHGGTLRAVNRPNGGARFEIELPARPAGASA